MDINSLERFIKAQENVYATALNEIKQGKKRSHWMWYTFPQLHGLGISSMAYTYGIADIAEAKAYLVHPILSARLIEICEALLAQENDDAESIFGHTDTMKLRSSMTLFAIVSENGSVFHKVLERFFDGEIDYMTLKLIGER